MKKINLVWCKEIRKIVLNARTSSQAVYQLLDYCDKEELEFNERLKNQANTDKGIRGIENGKTNKEV